MNRTADDLAGAAPFVRGSLRSSRLTGIFAASLAPCVAMAFYNTGLQANRAITAGATALPDGRYALLGRMGIGADPADVVACLAAGAAYFLPLVMVCCAGAWSVELAAAKLRERPTSGAWPMLGLLLALTLPPTTPLWQAFLGAAFGALFGQEVFGGPGMTFLHPVLLGRAFLFFAYPGAMSGDAPWIAASFAEVDGFSGATPLTRAMLGSPPLSDVSWWDCFVGVIPGSMGETSAFACLIGAFVLIGARVASPWIIVGVALGSLAVSLSFQAAGGDGVMRSLPFHWHVVVGSWAFGTVFLATDPASSPFTSAGRLIYGIGIGALVILIRVANAAYAEGTMLAILFMNVFAPLINYLTVRLHVRRRRRRLAV